MVNRLLASLFIVASLLTIPLIFAPATASAAVAPQCNKSAGFLFIPPWYKYLDVRYDSATGNCNVNVPKLPPPNNATTDVGATVTRILLAIFEIVIRIGGLIAVGFIIYGGFQFILSQGEPDKAKHARGTVINALVGLVISVSATAIVNLIARTVT